MNVDSERILIVEDSDLVRIALGFTVKDMGYRPVYATDGIIAISMLEKMGEK